MIVEIIRLEESKDGTFGVLKIAGSLFCYTLERPYLDNKRNISCIPFGSYICGMTASKKYGITYSVLNVRGRSGILFHPGNIVADTRGCVLLGEKLGSLYGKKAVLSSKNAFQSFLQKLNKDLFFNLEIKVL